MLVLIPFSLLLLLVLFYSKNKDFFASLTNSLVCIMLYVLFITNLFSIFSELTAFSVRISWLTFFSLLLAIFAKNKVWKNEIAYLGVIFRIKKSKIFPIYIIFMIIVFISIVCARLTVPDNYDSMTYHLARVAHWINNKSVNYYFTLNLRQLVSPVLDEYFLLHIILLSGDDKCVNLLQSVSYIVSALYIYKVAKMRGCSSLVSVIGSILFMTAPIAFAESLTTQNDLFATLCLWLFVYKTVSLFQKNAFTISKQNLSDVAMLGILIGIGYLSKTSVCLPMFFFAVCLVIYLLVSKKISIKDCSVYIMAAAIPCLLVISETFIRWKYYGSIDTSIVNNAILVGTKNPIMLFVNLLKNIAMMLVFSSFSGRVLKGMGKVLGFIFGIDINSPQINFSAFALEFSPNFSYHHDTASAYILAILGIVSILYLLLNKRIKKERKILALVIFLGFLTIPFVLRWQPWGTRIMLPCISLLSMLCALGIDEYCSLHNNIRQFVISGICTLCIVTFYPQAEYHCVPPLKAFYKNKERFSLYFANGVHYRRYMTLIEYCESLDTESIALCAGADSYVYPFLTYFRTEHNMRINESPLWDDLLDAESEHPEYIACVDMQNGDYFIMKDCEYTRIYSVSDGDELIDDYCVYKRND